MKHLPQNYLPQNYLPVNHLSLAPPAAILVCASSGRLCRLSSDNQERMERMLLFNGPQEGGVTGDHRLRHARPVCANLEDEYWPVFKGPFEYWAQRCEACGWYGQERMQVERTRKALLRKALLHFARRAASHEKRGISSRAVGMLQRALHQCACRGGPQP